MAEEGAEHWQTMPVCDCGDPLGRWLGLGVACDDGGVQFEDKLICLNSAAVQCEASGDGEIACETVF